MAPHDDATPDLESIRPRPWRLLGPLIAAGLLAIGLAVAAPPAPDSNRALAAETEAAETPACQHALPPGHPPIAPQALPPGHPPVPSDWRSRRAGPLPPVMPVFDQPVVQTI